MKRFHRAKGYKGNKSWRNERAGDEKKSKGKTMERMKNEEQGRRRKRRRGLEKGRVDEKQEKGRQGDDAWVTERMKNEEEKKRW